MSGVDVLAVMDDAAEKVRFLAEKAGVSHPATDLIEVRAAVAELIEAAKAATEEKYHDGASSRAACERLVAALARCGGAA